MEIEEANMKWFCQNQFCFFKIMVLIKQPTFYQNCNKPTSINLILTNVPRLFQSTCVLETGVSGFHLMTVAVMRKTFKNMRPKVINYRSHRDFSNKTYIVVRINNFSIEVFVKNNDGLQKFCKPTMDTLNYFSPIKKKYARGNQMSFMTKNLSKEIMTEINT